jgi:hypothetical protein
MLATIGTLGVGAGSLTEDKNSRAEREQIEMLLQALCQAARPSNSMRMELVYETEDFSRVYPMQPSGWRPSASHPIRTTKEYKITIRGIRTRIEYLQKSYKTKDSEEPYDIRHKTMVFDGARQLTLIDRIKSVLGMPKGSQGLNDKNSSLLVQVLYGWPFDLNDKKELEKFRFKLVKSDTSDVYAIDAITKHDTRYRFTIDGGKDFNLIKLERIRPNSTKDYETNFRLRQCSDGKWYACERERIRYPMSGKVGRPRIDHKVEITKAQFDVEVPDGTFVLKFPPGTRVWDEIMGNWFVVGAQEQALIEFELFDDP